MAEERIGYFYKNEWLNKDLSTWPVSSGTTCRLIGQPKVTWDNLGSLFGKHNYYQDIIVSLLNSDQNLYNVIQFCENNPNCVEIEIDKRARWGDYAGYHIFASCSIDLTKLIDSQSVPASSADKNVTVKWICNYGFEKQAPLDQFFRMILDLKTDPQKCGIVYKLEWSGSPSDTYKEHRHLSFLLDLRRYCGDVSGLNHDFDDLSKEQLIDYVDQFHKKYVEPNTPPSQHIAWTFLHTLKSRDYDCEYINKNLDWDNVNNWLLRLGPLVKLFNQVLPEFEFQTPITPSTAVIKTAIDQFQQLYVNKSDEAATTLLCEKMKSTEPAFVLSVDQGTSAAEQIGSIVGQFKAFLEKKQNAGKLVGQVKSAPIEDHVIFAIYGQLIRTNIIKDLKNPDSKAINILSFLTQNVQKKGLVASISVPDSGGKRLILVVNNLGEFEEEDLKPQLFDLVKRKGMAAPFVNSRFSLFFDNQIHADLGSVEAFNLFKTIVPEENVDRIDGIVVTEQAIRETAADISAEGVAAGIKFLMLSHMFLTRYYDNQDHQNALKKDFGKQLKELIKESTEMLIILRQNLKQSATEKDLQQEIEKLTPNLFQLAAFLELVLPVMPEGVELHSVALKDLNHNLSLLIESEILPKKYFN